MIYTLLSLFRRSKKEDDGIVILDFSRVTPDIQGQVQAISIALKTECRLVEFQSLRMCGSGIVLLEACTSTTPPHLEDHPS